MPQSLLGIVLAVLILVGGLMFGLTKSEDAAQKRALVFAFGTLALVVLGFFATVVVGAHTWATPWFAAASIGLPLAVFALTIFIQQKSSATTPRRRTASTRPVEGRPAVSAEEAAGDQPATAFAPLPVDTVASCEKTAPLAYQAPERTPLVEQEREQKYAPLAAAELADTTEFDPEPEPDHVVLRASSFERTSPNKPAAADAPEPASAPKRAVTSAFERKVEPVSPSKATHIAVVPQPEPVATEPAVTREATAPAAVAAPTPAAPVAVAAPTAAATKPETPAASQPSYDALLAKAHLLKKRGAYSVAARLFDEAASNADETAALAARFEQLTCYVKADLAQEARKLADRLRADEDALSAAQRIKLDAVARMA